MCFTIVFCFLIYYTQIFVKMDRPDIKRILASLGFDYEGDLFVLKLIHYDLCKLNEDDRLKYRVQVLELLRRYRAPVLEPTPAAHERSKDDSNSDGPSASKTLKIDKKEDTDDDIIIIDDE